MKRFQYYLLKLCICTIFFLCAALQCAGLAAAADLDLFAEYESALAALSNKGRPAPLEALAEHSPSSWIRGMASGQLADHHALRGNWAAFAKYAGNASACALLRRQLRSAASRASIVVAANVALLGNRRAKICKVALSEAASAGVLSDRQVWRRMRELIIGSKSRAAELLLPLLNDSRPTRAMLRRAIKQATRRIRGKHSLKKMVDRELLAVSAVVAARRRPQLAARRWAAFAKYFTASVNEQVWASIGMWAAREHNPRTLELYRRAPRRAEHSPDQLAWRVRAALRSGDWGEVLASVEAMSDGDRALSAWRYWHARALHELGQTAAARIVLQKLAGEHDDYYGLLAAEELGLGTHRGDFRPDKLLVSHMRSDADVRLAIAFVKSANTHLARKVWKHLRATLPARSLLAAAQVAEEAGWLLGSINAANDAAPAASNLALRFPTPHRAMIEAYCSRFKLDPAFVYSLIRRESRFNSSAVSSAGARGIMQIMPATAKQVARKHKYSAYRLSRLTRTDTNITIGTAYLDELERMFDGDPALMAVAYNAGPHRVAKWLRHGPVAKMVYVETIPFTETRLYVKAVLGAMVHYGRLFHGRTLSLRSLLDGNYT